MRLWRPPGAVAGAWLVATTLGIGASWFGLQPVLDVAVPDRAAALSAADVRHLAVPSPAPVPTLTGSGSRAPTTPGASAGATASATRSGHPAGSRTRPAGGGSAGSGPGSPDAPGGGATVVDGWTVTTQGGVVTYLRSFQVPGGSTVIRMSAGRVHLVSATPNPDYTVESSQSDPTRLVVQFIAPDRYDIVDAIWWNDRPYAQVSHVG